MLSYQKLGPGHCHHTRLDTYQSSVCWVHPDCRLEPARRWASAARPRTRWCLRTTATAPYRWLLASKWLTGSTLSNSGMRCESRALVKTQLSDKFPCCPSGLLVQSVVVIFFRLTLESQYLLFDSTDLSSFAPMLRLAFLFWRVNILKFVTLQLDACILIGKLIRR